VEAHRKGMNYERVLENVRGLIALRDAKRSGLSVGLISVFYNADAERVARALARFDALGIAFMLYKELIASFANRIDGYRAEALVDPAAGRKRRLGFWMSHQRGGSPAKP